MPYIPKKDQADVLEGGAQKAGELNYLITHHCLMYLDQMGASYQTYNDIIGALEAAKLELYRRKIAGYEDIKRVRNGDVY